MTNYCLESVEIKHDEYQTVSCITVVGKNGNALRLSLFINVRVLISFMKTPRLS